MVIRDTDREIARRMYEVVVGMVAARELRPDVREIADEALERPSPSSVRALLAVGKSEPWLPSVMDALAQVGIVAIEDVLGADRE